MSITRHTGYNLAGSLVPLAVTLVTVPLFLSLVGVERYGALTICWLLLGYVGFLDLGIGPAIAQKIAAARRGPGADESALAWTGLCISAAAGLTGAVIVYGGADLYFTHVANIEGAFQQEVAAAVPVLAGIVPVVLMSSVLSGILQGHERFLAINIVAVSGSTGMSLIPLALAYFVSPTLPVLVAGALSARGMATLIQLFLVRRTLFGKGVRGPARALIRPLLAFGGWVTLMVAAIPLLLTVDRLLIGALIGTAAVAIYSIPYGLVIRMTAIATSLGGALYPRFAYVEASEGARLQAEAIAAIAAVMTPVVLCVLIVMDPFLRLWIGADLASQSAPIGAILALGVWANCLAQVPYMFLQGSGRPEIPAKVLIAEILPYWLALAVGIWSLGLLGAAIAWTGRMIVDAILLSWFAGHRGNMARLVIAPAAIMAAAAIVAAWSDGPARYALLFAFACLGAGWSLFHLPRSIHSRLGRFRAFVPAPR